MSLWVHVLASAFGLGSWVAVNGLWVELPLIVTVLPEGWDLPSHLTVIIQLANLGPLLVTVAHRLCPGRVRESPVVSGVLALGVLSCALLAALWRRTSWFVGQERSTAFFALTFFLALLDCTSSVTFLPFMMQLPAKYVTSYFIGEGLSGLVPGLVALAQGVGMARCVNVSQSSANGSDPGFAIQTEYLPPNFSTEVFFGFLALMTAVSLAAFAALTRVPRTYQLSTENLVPESDSVLSVCSGVDAKGSGGGEERAQSRPLLAKPGHSASQLAFIYGMVVWVNGATNGLLPSVQTYSCMPYGHLAYHLSAALASMANPVACVFAMFRPKRSLVFLGVLCFLGSVFGGYNMAMAAMSPCPYLQGSALGEAIIVMSWVLFTGLLSYVKVMVGVILRDESHSALVWCGAAVQAGSLLGSVTMFPLVNIYHLFQAGDVCSTTCPS
ncbi:solute carrier family 52, riboflavin transporter, member 3-A [Alosa pseudoharengus]|uniref:solute carrier family 52, riboflavin transporter, member 3-A n=1 Tax=Alosa pseudoharengus TaxID=34774 RepID=UPI003F8A2430